MLEWQDPGAVRGNALIAGKVAEMSLPWLLSVYISNAMAVLFYYYFIRALELS